MDAAGSLLGNTSATWGAERRGFCQPELSAYDARKRADEAAGSLAQRRDAGTRQAPCSQRMPDTRLTAWHRLPCHPHGRPTSHRQSPKLGRHSSPFSASHRPRVHIFTRVRARGFVSTAPAGLTNTPSCFCGVFTIVARRRALPPRGAGLAAAPAQVYVCLCVSSTLF